MEEAKVYARKTVVVSLGDKSDEKKDKEEDNVIIDKVGIILYIIKVIMLDEVVCQIFWKEIFVM